MNSDSWNDRLAVVWQQQPAPKPVRNAETVIEALRGQVRGEDAQWRTAWRKSDRGYLWWFVILGVQLVGDHGWFDGLIDGLLLLPFVVWWLMGVSFWRQCRRLDGAAAAPTAELVARTRALLKRRQALVNAHAPVAFFLVVAVAVFAWRESGGNIGVTLGAALLVTAGLLWAGRLQRRIAAAWFDERLARLERIAGELAELSRQ